MACTTHCQAETGANGRDLNAQCLSADFGFDEAIAGGVFHANVERLPIDDYLVRRNSDIMHHISNLYLQCRGRTEPFSQLTINAARTTRLSRHGTGPDRGELTEKFRTPRSAHKPRGDFHGQKNQKNTP